MSSEANHTQAGSGGGRRQYINFGFYQVDPAWRRLPREDRQGGKSQFVEVVKSYEQDVMTIAYYVRDTPTFTCIHSELHEALDLLG
jgi:hypothetical protein